MSKHVLDASAVTAVLRNERGADRVMRHLKGSLISSVNMAEAFCNLRKISSDPEMDQFAVGKLTIEVVPFDLEQARIVASIYQATLGSSVGFADRACLALGLLHDLPVLTADHDWLKHNIGVKVNLFRKRAAA